MSTGPPPGDVLGFSREARGFGAGVCLNAMLALSVEMASEGITGDPAYAERVRHKRSVYRAMALDIIPFYPSTFETNWHGYIIDSLKSTMRRRQRALNRAAAASRCCRFPGSGWNNRSRLCGYVRRNLGHII
jgi:hypothetical protein